MFFPLPSAESRLQEARREQERRAPDRGRDQRSATDSAATRRRRQAAPLPESTAAPSAASVLIRLAGKLPPQSVQRKCHSAQCLWPIPCSKSTQRPRRYKPSEKRTQERGRRRTQHSAAANEANDPTVGCRNQTAAERPSPAGSLSPTRSTRCRAQHEGSHHQTQQGPIDRQPAQDRVHT